MFSHDDLMVIALSEATKVHPRATLPNPRVGAAILTSKGKLFFSHHVASGSSHAEVRAIEACKAAGADLMGATIAVTLEPCSHFGKTPPCADALIKEGFAKVLVGTTDPDSRVSGSGIERLKKSGIDVHVGVQEDACIQVNKEWFHFKKTGLPYVYLKMATSMDGLWTAESGESKWITGEEARQHAHTLRAQVGAMISTLKTVASDDAAFSARDKSGSLTTWQPDLAVVSRQEDWGDAWSSKIYACQKIPGRQIVEWKSSDFRALLEYLATQRGHVSCLVEAGPTYSAELIATGLVQEIWHYQGPKLLGGQGLKMKAFLGGQLPGMNLKVLEVKRFAGDDLLIKSVPS